MPNLAHLFVTGFTASRPFKSALSVRGGVQIGRNRGQHGQALLKQLERLSLSAKELAEERAARGLDGTAGMVIALHFAAAADFDFKTLEWKKDRIEVLSVVDAGDGPVVAIHVPDGKLSALEKRVQAYLVDDTKHGKPKHAKLVNAIDSIGGLAFDQLWTDDERAPVNLNQRLWFQLWLRLGERSPTEAARTFASAAHALNISVEAGFTTFPGRVVVAAQCTRRELEQAMRLLDVIAEIRSVRPNADFFLSELAPREQANWVQDLMGRCTFAQAERAPYVTLLDTGVNRAHLLLQGSIDAGDVLGALPAWAGADTNGHGTGMAGIVCYGDLVRAFNGWDDVVVPHRLESVKIFPPIGVNPPHLYGTVFAQAVDTVEQRRPERQRVFATMTTAIGPGAGKPTEWSAVVDQMAFGLDGLMPYEAGVRWRGGLFNTALNPRLFVLSAGNVPLPAWANYPTINRQTSVEDPGQAWNALTVGACTDLVDFDRRAFPDAKLISHEGGLAPASTTSLLWLNSWPIKPDVVAEGGNATLSPPPTPIDGPSSLRLLTTSHRQHGAPFAETGDTSAAAAEVARLAAHLRAQYPDYWPETIRALVVQGARYSPRMLAQLPTGTVRTSAKADVRDLLRTFGYGKVSLENSKYSGEQAPTLVVQDTLVPYRDDAGEVKLNELKMHELPWPAESLTELGGTNVELRVSLSYFVEPNPARRGFQSKFRYQSHGLRFAVKGAAETADRFRRRVNKLDRDEAALDGAIDDDESLPDPDRLGWDVGAQLRARGSLHSDVWTGTAAALAQKSHVAVFPVGGWWKDWAGSDRAGVEVRYALLVSLRILSSVDVMVDLYTPIQTAIAVVNGIEINEGP